MKRRGGADPSSLVLVERKEGEKGETDGKPYIPE